MRFLIILASIFVIACRTNMAAPGGPLESVSIGEGFTLAIGESASIDGANLVLTFSRVVQDSRCPSDVQCVWAGNGQLELVARTGNNRTTFILNTTSGAKEFTVNLHQIRLVALTPDPVSTQSIPPASYRAQLIVTKSGG